MGSCRKAWHYMRQWVWNTNRHTVSTQNKEPHTFVFTDLWKKRSHKAKRLQGSKCGCDKNISGTKHKYNKFNILISCSESCLFISMLFAVESILLKLDCGRNLNRKMFKKSWDWNDQVGPLKTHSCYDKCCIKMSFGCYRKQEVKGQCRADIQNNHKYCS